MKHARKDAADDDGDLSDGLITPRQHILAQFHALLNARPDIDCV
jgi:hypothetical protein